MPNGMKDDNMPFVTPATLFVFDIFQSFADNEADDNTEQLVKNSIPAVTCATLSSPGIPCPVLSCPYLSFCDMSCRVIYLPLLSCPVLSRFALSPVTS